MSQNTFNKAYDFLGGYEIGADITVLNNGYLICGTGSILGTSNLKFLRLDTLGNVLWSKRYGDEELWYSIGYAGGLVPDQIGNFYVTGSYTDTIKPEDFMVGKFNSSGDSVWFKSFGGSEQELGLGIYYDTLSHLIYATGSTMSFGAGTMSSVVWVLDTNGVTLDRWYYGGVNEDYGSSILRIGDTIFMSGYTNSFGRQGDPFLMKLDTLGNIGGQKLYGTAGEDYHANITSGHGNLLMWGRLDTLQGALFVAPIDHQNGDVIWRKLFQNYGYIYQAKYLKDKSIVMVGRTPSSNHIGHITKLDSLGNILWDREYSYNDPVVSGPYALCNFYDFDIDTATGAILALGNTQRDPNLGDTTRQDFWLMKLDSMGCLVAGCDTITDVGTERVLNQGMAVTVFPNPAKSTARVILNHGVPNSTVGFAMYDLAGKLVIAENHMLNGYGFGEWQVGLDGLRPGMYIYHIDTPDGKRRTGKLVVE